MITQEPTEAAIWHCLNHYDYADAIFLSERLYAEVKSAETLFLLATAYYRSGHKTQAYNTLLNRCEYDYCAKCQFLFGMCAYDLEKFAEAQSAILVGADGSTRSLDEVVTVFEDQAAFALMLLGKIAAKTENRLRAIEACKKALKLNPYLFAAFELLCKIGEKPDATKIFQGENIENLSMSQGQLIEQIDSVIVNSSLEESPLVTPQQLLSNANLPKYCPRLARRELFSTGQTTVTYSELSGVRSLLFLSHKIRSKCRATLKLQEDGDLNRTFGFLLDTTPQTYKSSPDLQQLSCTPPTFNINRRLRSQELDQTPNNKEALLLNCKPVLSQSQGWHLSTPGVSANDSLSLSVTTPTTPAMAESDQNVRRSSRLFSSVKENNKSSGDVFASPKVSSPPKTSKKTKQRVARNITNKNSENHNQANENNQTSHKEKCETITSSDSKIEKSPLGLTTTSEQQNQEISELQKESIDGLMALLRTLGQAYSALNSYECKAAIQHLQSLPLNQFNTPWVLCLMGLAYFEMNDYENSIKYFQTVHSQYPDRLDYMDVYSTALWHLQKEVELSALAQDLIVTDKNHAATWCVNGNCFSMHKEHDTAIKFFQRAVQVDPNCHYAYMLLGHEYITTEELDNALCCFRNAIRINPRHYNAWFGMGTIYSKQERYTLGEMYYNRALAINPNSSVILCHVGIVQHALNKTEKALSTFNKAIVNNPQSALCKYHRASIYFGIGRHSEALKELEELKQIVPKESSLYYLIGKVHKKLGNTDLALQHFSWATELDPKGASSHIKEAFDPAMGRGSRSFCSNVETSENPQSQEEYQSASSGGVQEEAFDFDGLPDDSEDSAFY